jgi:zinc-ribbon domain
VIEGWDDELAAQRKAEAGSGDRFCPTCGAERVAGARFCASCGRSFGAQPSPLSSSEPVPVTPPAAPARDRTAQTVAGVAWLIAAGLAGYLALQQFQLVSIAGLLGYDPAQLQATATINAIGAVITVVFGIALFQFRSRGFLAWSVVWAGIDVVLGAYQLTQGVSAPAFLGSIVAAAVAGIASFVARENVATASPPISRPAIPARPVAPAPAPPPRVTAVPVERPTPKVQSSRPSIRPVLALVAGGILLVAVVGVAASGALSPRPSPSPSPTPTGTPTPSIFVLDRSLPPGTVSFTSSSFRIGANGVTTVGFTFQPSQFPPTGSLLISVFAGSTLIGSDTTSVNFSGLTQTLTLTNAAAGTYRLEVSAEGIVIAQGSFRIIK